MPYVSHGTLKQYTRNRLFYKKAIEIIIPIAEALGYAHSRKIIHRDIKPANILFGESGEPILSDFGIAKILDAGEQTQLTSTGFGIGTPAYMAPEQWNGVADERTDIYALGIVLYELITGRCPFQADTPAAILIKQVQDPLPRPITFVENLPENVEALLFKALAKDPSLRFQTMQEFIQGMKSVLEGKQATYALPTQIHIDPNATRISGKPTTINPITSPEKKESIVKKKWFPWAIGGGALIVVICLVLILVIGLSNLNIFNRGEPTSVSLNASQNSTQETAIATEKPEVDVQSNTPQPKITNTITILFTSTPLTVDVIEGLPEDVPVFTPNNGDVSKTTAEGALMVSYSTSMDLESVKTFFSEKMASLDWQNVSTTELAGQNMVMYAFSKDVRNVVVNIMDNGENETLIQIILENG